MLSRLTQIAIAVLYDIHAGEVSARTFLLDVKPGIYSCVIGKLESADLIRHRDSSMEEMGAVNPNSLSMYELTRSVNEITLLNILEAMGEYLNCNHPTDEKMYQQYHFAANKLGVINYMTRLYLSEIHLADL